MHMQDATELLLDLTFPSAPHLTRGAPVHKRLAATDLTSLALILTTGQRTGSRGGATRQPPIPPRP